MNTFDDDLRRQLASLGSDLGPGGLPGAAAARKRAIQRTRHQITAAALGAAAIVAVGALGIIQADPTTAPAPADTGTPTTAETSPPTPSETPTESPSPDPSETLPTIPAGALLTAEDVAGPDGPAWEETPPGEPIECAPLTPEGAAHAHYAEGDLHRFDQFIESAEAPEQRMADLVAQIKDCVEQGGEEFGLHHVWTISGAGDDARTIEFSIPGSEPDATHVVDVWMLRAGQYVNVMAESLYSMEYSGASIDRPVRAAQRMCAAVGITCVGNAVLGDRLYPEPVGDLAGWLTIDDVATATGLEQITDGSELVPGGVWAMAGVPLDPDDAGATSVVERSYTDPKSIWGATVVQEIATFPDETAARLYYDGLVTANDPIQQGGRVVTNTGTVSGVGYVGTSWRLEETTPDFVSVYGVVIRGDSVTAVSLGITFRDHFDISPEQMRDLLDRAGQRLAGL